MHSKCSHFFAWKQTESYALFVLESENESEFEMI